jgi:rod shape-determining protein MreC
MKTIRFALIAIVLIATFHFVPFFDPAEAWLVRGFLAVGYGARSAALSVGDVFEQVVSAGKIEKENDDLKKQIMQLNETKVAMAALTAENDSLKGLLNFKLRTDLELIPSDVIGADPDETIHALIIDRGTESGVMRGDAVIVGDGTLVGRVERAVLGRSTVLLLTDPRCALAVMSSDHPESNGVAQGENGLVVSMSLIPQHAPITAGDTIVTTGLEQGIPRGLVLGTVESVESVASDPFISATVAPAVDPIDLTKVAVIHQK